VNTGTPEHDSHSSDTGIPTSETHAPSPKRGKLLLASVFVAVALVTFGVVAVLVSIFEHRQEARQPFLRMVEVSEVSTDPVPWGINWPHQYDTYRRTVDTTHTQYGGSSAMPASKLEQSPWLRRLYAGYAFSLDYREARGHAYMLFDQEVTERVTQRKQTGACLHCHASVVPTYRRLGLEAMGLASDEQALASDFNWPAVMEGFRISSKMDYSQAHAELYRTADGSDATSNHSAKLSINTEPREQDVPPGRHDLGQAHPVSCVDCHDPQTMQIRVTRPGFINGIAALAASEDPLPHLPSIERWRSGKRSRPYDPNVDSDRREMRTFVCAQCHVEYYCASKETLFFPWDNGLKVEQIEKTYDDHVFPDGTPFFDYNHGETNAPLYKAQHPEFELWSQGIHARSGVSCADCHMPYERQGAMKVSSHWVRSPMLSINRSCQTCHNVPEQALVERVENIQAKTKSQMERAARAMTDMLDAIRDAQTAGASQEQLAPVLELQKKGMWRLDFISSENSRGFHADQEAMRILGESIDYCRQAQALALQIRAPVVPQAEEPASSVEGVTPTDKAPPGPD
jgi:nitrite reductase (cytochrome c-552)